jgi:hypothetical protein
MVKEVEPQAADTAEEKVNGRPPHEPTPETRAKVTSLSSYGVPEKSIARLIGLGSKNTLRKHYVEELEMGNATFQALLGQTAARVALGGPVEYFPVGHRDAGKIAKAEALPNTTMLIFFLKTRLGLQERVSVDLDDRRPDDGNEFNTIGLTQSERTVRILGIIDAARTRGARRAVDSRRPVGTVSGEAARSGVQQRSASTGIRGGGGGRQD